MLHRLPALDSLPSSYWADKVMHGDFIHTAQGHPIYFEWVDNYDDLRVRFRPLIERMRATRRSPRSKNSITTTATTLCASAS